MLPSSAHITPLPDYRFGSAYTRDALINSR